MSDKFTTNKLNYVETSGKFINSLDVWNLYGASGTGKGTRVSQFLTFLMEKENYAQINISIDSLNSGRKNTELQLGLFFPQSKLLILGKWVKSNTAGRLVSFSSHDYLFNTLSKVCHYQVLYEAIFRACRILQAEILVFEGYAAMQRPVHMLRDRVYPHLLDGEKDNIKCYAQFYSFPTEREIGYELIANRIKERTGKTIKGRCWEANKMWAKVASEKSLSEMPKLNPNVIYTESFSHSAPITAFGEKLCQLEPNLNKYLNEFLDYSKTFNTLRNLNDIENSINKVNKYFQFQKENSKPAFVVTPSMKTVKEYCSNLTIEE